MKFDCGESWDEEKARLSQWHKKFAWFPVKLDEHDCRWLETVERKGDAYMGDWSWDYRAIK